MAVSSRQVNVGPNAVLLADFSTLGGGGQVVVLNSDAAFTVVLSGSSTLTSANGFALKAGASLSVSLTSPDAIWALAPGTTNTIVVHVFRAGV